MDHPLVRSGGSSPSVLQLDRSQRPDPMSMSAPLHRLNVLMGHIVKSAPQTRPEPRETPSLTRRIMDYHDKVSKGPPTETSAGVVQRHAKVVGPNSVTIGDTGITLRSKDTTHALSRMFALDPGAKTTVLMVDKRSGEMHEQTVTVRQALMLRQAIEDWNVVMGERLFGEVVHDPSPGYTERSKFDISCGHLAKSDGLPRGVELSHGWDILQNARSSEQLIFGLTRDVNHTVAYGHGAYTSESNRGAVFMPQEWSLFLNDCWVMGGIKGEVEFSGLTVFQHTPGVEKDDFSSSGVEKVVDGELEVPSFHIISVSVAEITALREYGYVPTMGKDGNLTFVPDKEHAEMRQKATLSDLAELRCRCSLTQAVEHITGDYGQVRGIYAFLQQSPLDQRGSLEVQQRMKMLYTEVSIEPLGPTSTENAIARRQLKINNAMEQLGLVLPRGPKDPLMVLQKPEFVDKVPLTGPKAEVAWREMRDCGLYIADKMIATVNEGQKPPIISKDLARAMKLELVREMEKMRIAIEKDPTTPFDLGSTPSIMFFLEARMDGSWLAEKPVEIAPQTVQLTRLLDHPQTRDAIRHEVVGRGYKPGQAEYMIQQFEIAMAQRVERGDVALRSMPVLVTNFFMELDGPNPSGPPKFQHML